MKRREFLQAMAVLPVGTAVQSHTWDLDKAAVVTDRAYGVVGDGVTNDRIALQRAINASVGKTLLITGKSCIDVAGLSLRSGSHIRFSPGASLKLLPYSQANHQILRIWDVDDVKIENAILDGSRELSSCRDNKGAQGYGMGISISGGTNVKILNPVTKNNWGDGIYISNSYASSRRKSEDIFITSHRAVNCRRQGVSIISGKNIRFDNPVWEKIGGTLPSAGLDIEPNSSNDILCNIEINNPISRQCRVGIQIWLAALASDCPIKLNIAVSNHHDYLSTKASFLVHGLSRASQNVAGVIASNSPTWQVDRGGKAFMSEGYIPSELMVQTSNVNVV